MAIGIYRQGRTKRMSSKALTLRAPMAIINRLHAMVPPVSIISPNHNVPVLHIAYRSHAAHHIGFFTGFVANNKGALQFAGIGIGSFGTTHIGCRHGQVL
jgi:hypothetical protein